MTRLVGLMKRAFGQLRDPLHRNSAFLLLDQAMLGGFGFLFWTLAAHKSSASSIGVATAIIGVMTFVASATTVGVPAIMLRFSSSDENALALFFAAISIVVAVSTLGSAVWVFALRAVGLSHSAGSAVHLMVFIGVPVTALGALGTFSLIALRRASLVVVKDAATVVKFVPLLVIGGASAEHLVTMTVAGAATATVLALLISWRTFERQPLAYRAGIRRLSSKMRYGVNSHIAAVVASITVQFLPAIMIAKLGAKDAAFVAIPLLIVGSLNVIPMSISNAMIAEIASDETSVRRRLRQAMVSTVTLAFPAVILLALVAPLVLSIFGSAYQEGGTTCLRWMAASVIFSSFNYLSDALLLVQQRSARYLVVNVVGTVAVVGLVVIFAASGPSGAGFGWFLGQACYLVISCVGLFTGRPRRSAPRHAQSVNGVTWWLRHAVPILRMAPEFLAARRQSQEVRASAMARFGPDA